MGLKILIVDDEEIVRDSVKLCLEPEGYEIHEATNGASGLAGARKIKPDLLILDLMMPDKWGYTVCEELRKDPETSKMKILFLTGRAGGPSRKMGLDKGGDDYLTKPFMPDELKKKVKELLAGSTG